LSDFARLKGFKTTDSNFRERTKGWKEEKESIQRKTEIQKTRTPEIRREILKKGLDNLLDDFLKTSIESKKMKAKNLTQLAKKSQIHKSMISTAIEVNSFIGILNHLSTKHMDKKN